MAKIQEEIIVVRLSKLVKDTDQYIPVVDKDVLEALDKVVQELCGPGVVSEIETSK